MDSIRNEDGTFSENLNDIFDVINEDMFGGNNTLPQMADRHSPLVRTPYIEILEQPAAKAVRFRYECEGRSAGSIPGFNSTPENKTYPTIQIVGHKGRAVIVVSCVTRDEPYKPHPHNLVGRESCKRGVCTTELNSDNMIASFSNLGIQCVKRKDIEEALSVREKIKVDPFRTGFQHKNQIGNIDLNCVRLCFQAYLEGPVKNKFTIGLEPVVSEPIYDKKATADLVICQLSHCAASASGGTTVILLCEKVNKEDISVRLFEERDGLIVWEDYAEFSPAQVHKQVAITFKTPRYRTLQIEEPVNAWIQLKKPSNGSTSEPRRFIIYPVESGTAPFLSLKRGLFCKGNQGLFDETTVEEKKMKLSEDIEEANDIEETNLDGEIEKVIEEVEIMEEVEFIKTNGGGEAVMEARSSPNRKRNSQGSLKELLDQVKDLEEMFPGGDPTNPEFYTSFQMAMKNPLSMNEIDGYEDVPPPRPTAPKPQVPDPNVLPPLPPKRAKKTSPAKNLPPIPEKTKLNIFQKLFFSKKKKAKSLAGSVGTKGSSRTINSEIIGDNKVELTEAENYALYTTFAPRATLSECDEMSFYYSPVESQKAK